MLLALYQIETGQELFKPSAQAAAGPRSAPVAPGAQGQPKVTKSSLKGGQGLKPTSLEAIAKLKQLRGGG